MALCLRGPVPRLALGVVLIVESSLFTTLAQLSHDATSPCDGEHCMDISEPESNELYLLQRKARVVRKPTNVTMETRSLAKDSVNAPGSSVRVTKDSMRIRTKDTGIQDKCQHSRASAFVTAARPHAVPLSLEQRRAMRSTMEVSGLSEKETKLVIGTCCLVLVLAGLIVTVIGVMECRFARIFRGIIEEGLRSVAEEMLHVEVTVGSISVAVFSGRILLTDLKIANPPDCESKSFLEANIVDARLNLWHYAWKRIFRRAINVELDSVTFMDVNLTVEKSKSSTNVKDMLNAIDFANGRVLSHASKSMKRDATLIIHKMEIADAVTTVPPRGRIAMPTVQCRDFDKATKGEARTVRPAVAKILQEFCRSGEWADEKPITYRVC